MHAERYDGIKTLTTILLVFFGGLLVGPLGLVIAIGGIGAYEIGWVLIGGWILATGAGMVWMAWILDHEAKRPPPAPVIHFCVAPDCYARAVQKNFVGITDSGLEIAEWVCARHRAGVWSNDQETEFR